MGDGLSGAIAVILENGGLLAPLLRGGNSLRIMLSESESDDHIARLRRVLYINPVFFFTV